MEYTDLISRRESIRNYDPNRLVPRVILEKILDAGRVAPSACNYQPYKFLIITSPAVIDKVRASYNRDWFKDAPHILVVVGYNNQSWKRSYDGYNSIETDVAIAMTHIILAAENEGVGTCWIAAYDPMLLRKAINLEDNQLVFGISPIGYPKPGFQKSLLKKRKPLADMVEFL
jgi:nitroreductase